MQPNLQRQPQIKILPALTIAERHRLKEADIDDVVNTVKAVIPQHVDENIDVTITLLEKNLRIMPDMALMKEALTDLIRNAMDAMSGYGKFALTVSQVNFEIESLLNAGDSLIGACDFISLAGGTEVRVDEKIKEKIFEPFFITKTVGHRLGLAVAYRILRRHHDERIKAESRAGQGIEVNIYLPLTKLEIVNMMSIPAG